MTYRCHRKVCEYCPYEYCVNEEEPYKAYKMISDYRQRQRNKTGKEKQAEAWHKWYERHKEAERERGKRNYRKRKETI